MVRGEIYMADLDRSRGREQNGRRPVLVLSRQEVIDLPLVVTVVPGTTGTHLKRDFKWNVRVPASDSGLKFETVFLCFQIRALDPSRFEGSPVGSLSDEWMKNIEVATRYALDFSDPN